jgi:hypothetical protein
LGEGLDPRILGLEALDPEPLEERMGGWLVEHRAGTPLLLLGGGNPTGVLFIELDSMPLDIVGWIGELVTGQVNDMALIWADPEVVPALDSDLSTKLVDKPTRRDIALPRRWLGVPNIVLVSGIIAPG